MATAVNVEQAIKRAFIIAEHNPSYSMENRGYGLDAASYDCSSFIASCWKISSKPATNAMESEYHQHGFEVLSYTSSSVLRRGDILVWYYLPDGSADPDHGDAHGHTAMYLGDGTVIQAAYSRGGVRGTGRRGPGAISAAVPYKHCILRGTPGLGIKSWTPSDDIQDGWTRA